MAQFDLKKVLNIVDNDKGMARTLLEMTLDLGSADMVEMRKLADNNEFVAAGKLAHKLKSSTATLGFQEVSDLMKDLEHYTKSTIDVAIFESKLCQIELITDELFDFIRQALSSELK
jgi:HPt (histidine-containing phosphotransfer) domain-containing protein